ncbi:MerR family DNA-binding transcriptional regulator [Acinetobacter junii]|uniref:MerR family DNA-binding transcriptional regulator n=1 Tax=Acinetobacter junii TaxID=40215 RepID=UPI0032133EA5
MKIGQLAKRTGVSIRMLRYYEEEGLLNPIRSESGYREYSVQEEELVHRILVLSQAGLKLDAVRLLLPCISVQQLEINPCEQVLSSLQTELDNMDEKLEKLIKSRRILGDYLLLLRQKHKNESDSIH